MQEVAIYSVGNPPAFAVPTDDPAYWTERLSHELSTMLHDAAVEGMSIKRPEAADFDVYSSDLETFIGSVKTWVSQAFDRSNSRSLIVPVAASVPALSSVAGLLMSGGGALLVPLLLRVGIQLAIEIVAGQANNLLDGGSEIDLTELVQTLKEGLLRSENGETAKSLLADMLTDEAVPVGLGAVLARALLRSENVDAAQSVLVTESGGSEPVRVCISDVLYKALLTESEDAINPLLALALTNFHVRVYQDDGRHWLEFGLVENDGLVEP